jgi:alpha-tubulin suppressor-like RCC1 family protein
VFGNVTTTSITANGVNLGTAVAEAFVLANNANKSTTSDTAPANPKVGDSWFDTVTGVILRYTYDGVSNNWIDISGPQNAGFIYQSYSLSSNTTSLNESGSNTSVALTVSTINNADGTTLYWTISGSTSADFTDGSNSGSVSITNNSGTIIRTLVADLTTEGVESFIAQLRTGSTSGPIVAIAPVITVADTSQSPSYKIWSWGFNNNGQLGIGNTSNQSSPTQIGSNTNWYKISSQGFTSTAIKTDGTLWAWGHNNTGQLGINNISNRNSPTQIGAETNWASVASGKGTTFAIKLNGTLWSWGGGTSGELGLNIGGSYSNRSSPIQVGSDTNWSKISAGESIVLAIKTNGTLWTWGSNGYGQSGQNHIVNRSSPVQVGSDTNWSNISNGVDHAIATKTDGTLWTWGRNNFAELGLNDTNNRSSPVQIGSATNWSKISASQDNSSAIKTDGTLWTWGRNSGGQLGLNDLINKSSPVQVGSGTNWYEIGGGFIFSVAIKTDGTLWTWGNNGQGQLGNNSGVYRSSPVQVGTETTWTTISSGEIHSIATSN